MQIDNLSFKQIITNYKDLAKTGGSSAAVHVADS